MIKKTSSAVKNIKVGENPFEKEDTFEDDLDFKFNDELSRGIVSDENFMDPGNMPNTQRPPDITFNSSTIDAPPVEHVAASGRFNTQMHITEPEAFQLEYPVPKVKHEEPKQEQKLKKQKSAYTTREPPKKPQFFGSKPIGKSIQQSLSNQAKERKVPGSRIGRVFSFGSEYEIVLTLVK